MFTFESENREFGLKPMNCPGHCALYGHGRWSYRDLPIRMAEAGNLHRNELSGALHGLLRVRMFAQDDAHIFCEPSQIEDEVLGCLDFGFALYELLGLEIKLELSTRPENRVGSDEDWDAAEAALAAALDRRGIVYTVNEGDGAFYGPKIDLHMLDVLGRALADRHRAARLPAAAALRPRATREPTTPSTTPSMIHRALLGSFERFIGILIEHFGGAFPVWLAPVQVRVLPVAGDHSGRRVRSSPRCPPRASAPTSTSATTPSASASARPRSRRCRTSSSGATARSTMRWPFAGAGRGSRRWLATSWLRRSGIRCPRRRLRRPGRSGHQRSDPWSCHDE